MTAILFILGLILLLGGAELLVRGASRLAAALGLSPLVIGLTIVAFGTSSPEFSVSLKTVLSGQPEVAAGNVIGSNIFNVLFILGISAFITPLNVQEKLIRYDVPFMIVLSGLVWIFSYDTIIGWFEGLFLLSVLMVYIVLLIYFGRKKKEFKNDSEDQGSIEKKGISLKNLFKDLIFIAFGLTLLVYGSGWFVDGAIAAARILGVSELIIGLTIVAGS